MSIDVNVLGNDAIIHLVREDVVAILAQHHGFSYEDNTDAQRVGKPVFGDIHCWGCGALVDNIVLWGESEYVRREAVREAFARHQYEMLDQVSVN